MAFGSYRVCSRCDIQSHFFVENQGTRRARETTGLCHGRSAAASSNIHAGNSPRGTAILWAVIFARPLTGEGRWGLVALALAA